jgi:hypothetical protein
LIYAFENDGSGQGVWTAIRKDEVVSGLRERIAYKDGLDQHRTGLCAVAALVHAELQDDPVSFVTLAIGLYKAGQASWRGKVVRPNAELMRNPPPDGEIINGTRLTFNRADWIVMSSIRNTINPADHYARTSRDGTDFDDLQDFVRKVGYTKVEASYHANSISKDLDNALRASELLRRGYRVILNINAVMLYADTQADWGGEVLLGIFPKPNHVVQLVEKVEVYPIGSGYDIGCKKPESDPLCGPPYSDPNMPMIGKSINAVRFAVFTWADGHRQVPEDPRKPLKIKDFEWNYYGFLAFKD